MKKFTLCITLLLGTVALVWCSFPNKTPEKVTVVETLPVLEAEQDEVSKDLQEILENTLEETMNNVASGGVVPDNLEEILNERVQEEVSEYAENVSWLTIIDVGVSDTEVYTGKQVSVPMPQVEKQPPEEVVLVPYEDDGCSEPVAYRVHATFKQSFIDNYEYEDSTWYMFALQVNGKYFNVFRNSLNWVANSKADNLNWAVPAIYFNEWVEWYIPMNEEVKVARDHGQYGFVYHTFTSIDEVSLSSTKEVSGEEIADFYVEPVCS